MTTKTNPSGGVTPNAVQTQFTEAEVKALRSAVSHKSMELYRLKKSGHYSPEEIASIDAEDAALDSAMKKVTGAQ